MVYYAHSVDGKPESEWQTLQDHSQQVAELVAQFSTSFCEPEYAKNLGLLHDVGKYQIQFQKRLHGCPEPVDHATCGAQLWMERGDWESGAYCIAGHHGGLPDGGSITDVSSSLLGRLKSKAGDYSAYQSELSLSAPCDIPWKNAVDPMGELGIKEYAFWTRMMFSSLTDGDYLDTEQVYTPATARGISADFPVCLSKIRAKLDGFSQDTPVNQARHQLRMDIQKNAHQDGSMYLLNLPTGAGKTLVSMEFALQRAVLEQKKRIIYVIPYTSIIEQNAAVFRDVLGDCLLEHHCNFNYETVQNDTVRAKLQNAAENWDADIIVTTNVQFFQSIYANRSRDVRKLHNIADSIIIFDEVHMLPSKFYVPCLEAIQILTSRYNCEALLMSATLPDFPHWFGEFELPKSPMISLVSDTKPFQAFRRCQIENLDVLSMEDLLAHIDQDKSILLVVNQRKTAKLIYDRLPGKKFHLSTYMNHHDRTRVITEIRQCLGKEPLTLVSTSLIEAGVDLDFDQVYRELAGLDNLLQTAGRCNREGKKENCVTYSFSFPPEEFPTKIPDLQLKQNCMQEISQQYKDVACEEAITTYFNRFYQMVRHNLNSHNTESSMKNIYHPAYQEFFTCDFRTYAEAFRLIDDNTRTIVIPSSDSRDLLDQLRPETKRTIQRKLQPYCISLRPYEYAKLREQGVLGEKCGVEYLTNGAYYHPDTGITWEDDSIYIV